MLDRRRDAAPLVSARLWGSTTSPTSCASHSRERADRTALVLGDRRADVGRAVRAGRAASPPASPRPASDPQDRVAFLDKNGIEHFEVFFGAALLNAVCVDVNWRLAPPEVEFIVNDAEAKVFVVGARLRAGARRHRRPTSRPSTRSSSSAATTTLRGLRRAGSPSTTPTDPRHAEQAATTSRSSSTRAGTTGRPKGVMLTNDNFFAPAARSATDMWELRRRRREPRGDAAVPHRRRRLGGGGMYVGATSVIVRELDPAALVRLIPSSGITHAFLVPAVLQFMLMVPGVEDADFSTLRDRSSTAPRRSPRRCSPAASTTFGCKLLAGLRPHRDDRRGRQPAARGPRPDGPEPPPPALVRRGRARASSCASSTPRPARTSPTGEVGEIWIRSPQVMKGYWNNAGGDRRGGRRRRLVPQPATPATSTTTATSTSTTG